MLSEFAIKKIVGIYHFADFLIDKYNFYNMRLVAVSSKMAV